MQKAWAHLRRRAERVRGVGETEGLGGVAVGAPFGSEAAAGAGAEVAIVALLVWCLWIACRGEYHDYMESGSVPG